MENEMKSLMTEVLHGKKFVRLSLRQLRFSNDYLADACFSLTRMEAIKTAGSRAGRRLDYDILVLPEHEDDWAIFLDPERSRAHVKEIIAQALREGGSWEFLVWAEAP